MSAPEPIPGYDVWALTTHPTADDLRSIADENVIDNRDATANDTAELLEDEEEDEIEEARDTANFWTDSDGINRDGGEPW